MDEPEVAAVLDRPFLDYGEPLRAAWEWTRGGRPVDLKQAEQLLVRLTEPDRFEFALPVWYERAFNLVRQERGDEARTMLEEIGQRFGPALDEDTYCLWGRLHKDEGDTTFATANGPGGEHDLMGVALAERAYGRAEDLYCRAYEIRRDRFPGINVATMRLVRSGLVKLLTDQPLAAGEAAPSRSPTSRRSEVSSLVASARILAQELLAGSVDWPERLPDDPIWIGATRAEAYVVLGDWAKAVNAYRVALDPRHAPAPVHRDGMRSQLARLVAAYRWLGQALPAPLADPANFFSSATERKTSSK